MIFSRQVRRNAIKLEGERSSSLDLARGRLALVGALFVLAYMMLAVRAVDLTVIQGGLSGAAEDAGVQQAEDEALSAVARADITDRNGVLLATTIKTASLFADTQLISDPQATAEGLVKIFPELSFGDVLQKLQSGKRFIWIRRNIVPADQQAVLELGQPGLEFKYEDMRVYPQGPLTSHLVGFTDIDNHGQSGVERSFDKMLTGGAPLALTLDVRLQHALRREIARAISDFSAKAGAGIIMDVTNGEVLAGVSLPDFDPQNPGAADDESIFNRLTLGVYELGSVFKIFSTAALFETLNVPMSTTFDAREPIRIGRFTISDYHAEKRILTIPEVFMYSSNIGAAMMGRAVGTDKLESFYRDLGLMTPLQFEVHEISAPIIPSPWREVNTLTASYGHGIATTPLQMCAAVSSIANGGLLVKPTLIYNPSAPEKSQNSEEIRVVSPQTAHRMLQLMRLVVTEGTGKNADVPGYMVGGKTGTAEKNIRGAYQHDKLVSSFMGVFPVDEPRYAVFIMVDEPRGNRKSFGYATGGWVAAPAVARVVASTAAILGLRPEKVVAAQDLASGLKQYVSVKGHD